MKWNKPLEKILLYLIDIYCTTVCSLNCSQRPCRRWRHLSSILMFLTFSRTKSVMTRCQFHLVPQKKRAAANSSQRTIGEEDVQDSLTPPFTKFKSWNNVIYRWETLHPVISFLWDVVLTVFGTAILLQACQQGPWIEVQAPARTQRGQKNILSWLESKHSCISVSIMTIDGLNIIQQYYVYSTQVCGTILSWTQSNKWTFKVLRWSLSLICLEVECFLSSVMFLQTFGGNKSVEHQRS